MGKVPERRFKLARRLDRQEACAAAAPAALQPSAIAILGESDMGVLDNILAGGIGSIIEQTGKLVEQFHLSEADKKQFQLQLEALLQQRDAQTQDSLRAEMEARQKVIVAELQQDDNYTKRARPSLAYAGLVFIFINYVLIPGVQYLTGHATAKCQQNGQTAVCEVQGGIPLPQEFWWAWAGVVGTWSIGRSFEKVGVTNRVTRTITGSAPPRSDEQGAVG
jgi:hypothetical protein